MNDLKDFSEFNKPAADDINQLLVKELKGGLLSSLVWQNENGIDVEPYYLSSQRQQCFPGAVPYLRGNKADGNESLLRQDFILSPEFNKQVLESLACGAQSIGVIIPKNMMVDWEAAFKGVLADIIHVHLISHKDDFSDFHTFLGWYQKNGFSIDQLKGTFHQKANPSIPHLIPEKTNGFRSITIDGTRHSFSGAFAVTEMALVLSETNERIQELLTQGLSIDDSSALMSLRMGVGSSFFVEIAKLRAIRTLYAAIIRAYNPEHACSQNVFLSASTTKWNKTTLDMHNNLLRTTTEAMAGSIGGVDELLILPFDEVNSPQSDTGLRLARNIRHILFEEGRIHVTADPGGGSHYIEQLTDLLSDKSWALFQKIESKGGFNACRNSGFIHDLVAADAAKAKLEVKEGKRIIVGVNKFPPASAKGSATSGERLTGDFESELLKKGTEA